MALKDWKKTLDETYSVHFYNKKTGNKLKIESVFINNAPNQWQIRIGGEAWLWGNVGIIKSNLKTKSQALKFAKAYMRRN